MLYNYVSIEGNIGVGKTTLASLLAQKTDSTLVLERFEDNPFLEKFYSEPERYAFSVEMSFLADRYKQLSAQLTNMDIFKPSVISDYYFLKNLVFAKVNLQAGEFDLYKNFYNMAFNAMPKPDLLIYLHRSPESAKNFIKKRGRSFERDISLTYLQKISEGYLELIKTSTEIPIVLLDADQLDFLERDKDLSLMLKLLNTPFEKGLNYPQTGI